MNKKIYFPGILIVMTIMFYGCQSRKATPILSAPVTVTDADGNTYNTIVIGKQCWMKENLRTTRFRDSSAIAENGDSIAWIKGLAQAPAWCYYGRKTSTDTVYGKIYNWYAATDPRHLCPAGWHVPTDSDASQLTDYLGGEDKAGGKMKATNLWEQPNTGADNSSGFTLLPSDNCDGRAVFHTTNMFGGFWASTESSADHAWTRSVSYDFTSVSRSPYYKGDGFSVRCIKD